LPQRLRKAFLHRKTPTELGIPDQGFSLGLQDIDQVRTQADGEHIHLTLYTLADTSQKY